MLMVQKALYVLPFPVCGVPRVARCRTDIVRPFVSCRVLGVVLHLGGVLVQLLRLPSCHDLISFSSLGGVRYLVFLQASTEVVSVDVTNLNVQFPTGTRNVKIRKPDGIPSPHQHTL